VVPARLSAASAEFRDRRGSLAWCGVGVVIIVLLVVSAASSAGARAVSLGPAAGRLDRSFGSAGKVVTDSLQSEYAAAVAVQRDGKVLVAGPRRGPAGGSRALVARYLTNGRLDRSFGSGGVVTFGFGVRVSDARDLAVQPDGRIVVAGLAGDDFAVARVSPDGTLDQTFGQGGRVTTDLGAAVDPDGGEAVALQPDGKIVVAGDVREPGPFEIYDFAIARYDPDGSVDASFGAGGHITTGLDIDFRMGGVAVQPDGKIVAAGATRPYPSSGPSLAVVRLNPDGSIDSSFGDGGAVTGGFGEGDDVLVSGGKILVAGGDLTDMTVSRFNADGTLDNSFGLGGVATAHFAAQHSGQSFAKGVAVQHDGEIVAAGFTRPDNVVGDFAVARFNPDGRPDPAFGAAGKTTTDLQGHSYDEANGLALTTRGKILVAGYTDFGAQEGIALVRYYGTVCAVPNVVQQTLPAARKAIANGHCGVGTLRRVFSTRVGKGRIVSEEPATGTRLRMGSPLALVISKGKRRK